MLTTLFHTIPKGTNEFIFISAIVGCVFLLSRKNRNGAGFLIGAAVIALMLAWRILYTIHASRYSIALIFPFSLLSAYCFAAAFRSGKLYLKIVAGLAICSFLAIFGIKLFNVTAISQDINVVADVFRNLKRSRREYAYMIQYNDYWRLRQHSGIKDDFYITYSMDKQVLNDMIVNHTETYRDTVLDILTPGTESNLIDPNADKRKYRHILSLYSQKNKKRKHQCFIIRSLASCRAISQSMTAMPDDNLLVNGDVELTDDPKASFEKLRVKIPEYETYFGVDDHIRTPENAYYYNKPVFLQDSPRYDCTDQTPIAGKRSVRINISNGTGFILFSQKLTNGDYKYSVLVRGNRGTEVKMLYDTIRKNKGLNTELASFTIPDKRLYELSATFSVKDLEKNDYFMVVASVENGEAYLDQFSLTAIPPDSSQ